MKHISDISTHIVNKKGVYKKIEVELKIENKA